MQRLAERLRAAGRRVWFDEWVIQPGDDIARVGQLAAVNWALAKLPSIVLSERT